MMEKELIDFLLTNNCAKTRTGSREICNPAPTDTDEDWIIFAPIGIEEDLFSLGFTIEGQREHYSEMPLFQSYRKGDLNLIVTNRQEFYERFVLATHLCKRLNLLDKAHRILVFKAILYGEAA